MVVLPSSGTAEVTTKALACRSTSTNCRFVRSTRNDSARGAWDAMSVMSGVFTAAGVVHDGARGGRFCDLRGDVVRRLDPRVEEFADHGEAEAEHEPHQQAQRDIALRPRRDRDVREGRGVHDGRLKSAPPARPVGVSSSRTRSRRLFGVGLSDQLSLVRVRVGDRDVQVDRFQHRLGRDLVRHRARLDVDPGVRDDALRELSAADQIGIRLDPLGRELATLEQLCCRRSARSTRSPGGHSMSTAASAESESGESRGQTARHHRDQQDRDPAASQDPQVVTEFHIRAGLPPVPTECQRAHLPSAVQVLESVWALSPSSRWWG